MKLMRYSRKHEPAGLSRLGVLIGLDRIADLREGYALYLLEEAGNPKGRELAAIYMPPYIAQFLHMGEPAWLALGDAYAYLWIRADGALEGDQAAVSWIRPSGLVHRTDRWDPLPADGKRCLSARLRIAGDLPADEPGRWLARVEWNGMLMIEHEFAVLDPSRPMITEE